MGCQEMFQSWLQVLRNHKTLTAFQISKDERKQPICQPLSTKTRREVRKYLASQSDQKASGGRIKGDEYPGTSLLDTERRAR